MIRAATSGSALGLRTGWATSMLVIAVGLTALLGMRRVIRADRQAAATATVVDTLTALLSQLKDAETGQRGFIITGDPAYLEPLQLARTRLPSSLAATRRMTRGLPGQADDLDLLVGLIARRFGEIDTTIVLRGSAGLSEASRAVQSNSGKRSMDSIRLVVDRMNGRARDSLVSTARQAEAASSFGTALVVLGTLVALVLAIVSQLAVTRTARSLQRTSGSLSAANDQLIEANAALAQQTTLAEAARVDAMAADEAKVDFLAVMSHELRTPLNAILGFTALLTEGMDGPVAPRQAEYLTRIRDAGQRLLGMIDEILIFTKSGTDRHLTLASTTDVSEVVREFVAEAASGADHKGLTLDREIPLHQCLAVGDRSRIRRVLGHLIDNAIKFTNAGSIRVSVRVEESRVVIEVADTGVGIMPDDLQRMFEPFSQADPARTRRAAGAGMGLAVARRTAQLLGGDIDVTSAPGRGSVFTVVLMRALALM